MSNVCAKNINVETKMWPARKNCQDGNQGNQGCVADQQGIPAADLESAAEMSEIGIGTAAWREYPFC